MEEFRLIYEFVFDVIILLVILLAVTTIHKEYLKDKQKERQLVDAKIEVIKYGKRERFKNEKNT